MFMISCSSKTKRQFCAKLRGAPVAIGAVAAMAFALVVQSAEASDSNTVSTGKMGKAGFVNVEVTFDNKIPIFKSVPTTKDESPKDVAAAIIKEFGADNASPNDDGVFFKNATHVDAARSGGTIDVDNKKVNKNSIGVFGFDPGFPDLGPPSNSLLADALITAGFEQGLSPISITEPAGTTIEQLALDTVNALDAAGYAASLLDSHDFLLGAQGAILPTDFLLGAGPVDGSSNLGISLSVSDVPESSTWAMMLLGFAGLGYLAFRTSNKNVALTV